ncbi:hypothetical protein BDW22DRAFT_1351703 [Trametopsis cervina]|nr:hypothetical protein BDW22DRAFT_1351703 [Trametopsis cervina]
MASLSILIPGTDDWHWHWHWQLYTHPIITAQKSQGKTRQGTILKKTPDRAHTSSYLVLFDGDEMDGKRAWRHCACSDISIETENMNMNTAPSFFFFLPDS